MDNLEEFANEVEQALTADYFDLKIKIVGYYEGTKGIATHQIGTGLMIIHA